MLEPFPRPRGLVAARNALLQAARGEFICWSDSDDVSAPRRIEKQVAFLETHPHIAAVGTGIYHADADMTVMSEQYFSEDPERQRFDPDICCATVMTTRVAAQAAGLFQPAFAAGGEDGDWILRLGDRYSVSNICDLLYTYRHHAESTTNDRGRAAVVRRLGVMARASARARRAGMRDFVRDLDPSQLAAQLGPKQILDHPYLAKGERMLALSMPCQGEEPVLSVGIIGGAQRHLARLIGALDAQSFESLELLVTVPQSEMEAVARIVARSDCRISVRIVGCQPGADPWVACLRAAHGMFVLAARRGSRPSPWKCWGAVKLCLDHPQTDAWVYRQLTTEAEGYPQAQISIRRELKDARMISYCGAVVHCTPW